MCWVSPGWKQRHREAAWAESLSRLHELEGQAWPGAEVVSPALPLRVRVQVESITFRVVQPPRHGLIERSGRGQRPLQATTFTMDDI